MLTMNAQSENTILFAFHQAEKILFFWNIESSTCA